MEVVGVTPTFVALNVIGIESIVANVAEWECLGVGRVHMSRTSLYNPS